MPFTIFDPDADVRVSVGNLPHWYQPGVTYFITFRTEDSVPRQLMDLWHARRNEWLQRHGVSIDNLSWKKQLEGLPERLQNEFHNLFSREFMEYLDRSLGDCVLRRPDLAEIVFDSLLHFDRQRYEMGDFVIMPN